MTSGNAHNDSQSFFLRNSLKLLTAIGGILLIFLVAAYLGGRREGAEAARRSAFPVDCAKKVTAGELLRRQLSAEVESLRRRQRKLKKAKGNQVIAWLNDDGFDSCVSQCIDLFSGWDEESGLVDCKIQCVGKYR